MKAVSHRVRTSLLVAAFGFSAQSAAAHIDLLSPVSRYPAGRNKSCPCGSGSSNRRCDLERDASDPSRSGTVTVLEAGSTITVEVDETVGHAGRMRVAFDPDGADYVDFNANILLDVPDPRGSVAAIGEGSIWRLDVTLPTTPCTNCTLQVIQVMNGDTENAVVETASESTYYTCADIEIVAPGTIPADQIGATQSRPVVPRPVLPDPEPEASGSDPAPTAADAGVGTTSAPATPSSSSAAADSSDGEGSGGGCAVGGAAPVHGLWAMTALGLLGWARRRRTATAA